MLLCHCGNLFARPTPDLEFILRHRAASLTQARANRTESSAIVPDFAGGSEIGLLAIGVIKIYQTAISSQDVAACNFLPSCSRFTIEAIRQGGALRGALLGADRLMRCHWFAPTLYSDEYGVICIEEMCRLNDPVERYIGRDE